MEVTKVVSSLLSRNCSSLTCFEYDRLIFFLENLLVLKTAIPFDSRALYENGLDFGTDSAPYFYILV